jgi:pyrroloquinoline quinone biosynthesis protein B
VTGNGEDWLLVNASPDLRQQIAQTPPLAPRHGQRHSPLAAVLLTNGDVDHVAGLLTLRESQPFRLFATAAVLQAVDDNRIFSVCNPTFVPRVPVAMSESFEPVPGLRAELFAVPGKVALWLDDESMKIGEATENTVGLELSAGGKRLLYIPACAEITPALKDRIQGADVLLFDGTMWTDSEMIEAGLGTKSARRMGHIPLSGADGSIAALAQVRVARRIFVHINNTNSILIDGSAERQSADASGWETGFDGMRIEL